MTYTKQTWHDSPAIDTPISAARLGHIEDGIEDADAAVSTIAALRAITETRSYIRLLGYYAEGDGGGGVFRWDPSEHASTDNGGTIITPSGALASSGRWKRVYEGEVNGRWFGMSPNHPSADNTAALQAAVTWVCTDTTRDVGGGPITGGTVFVPMGYYRCKFDSGTSGLSTITINSSNVFIKLEPGAVLTVRRPLTGGNPATAMNYFFTFTHATQGYGGGLSGGGKIEGNSQLKWGIYIGTWKFPTFENFEVLDVFGGAIRGQTTDPSNGGYNAESALVKHIEINASTGGAFAQYGVLFEAGPTRSTWTDCFIEDVVGTGIWDTAVVLDGVFRFNVQNPRSFNNLPGGSSNTITGTTKIGCLHTVKITCTNDTADTSQSGFHVVDDAYLETHAGSETAPTYCTVLIDVPAGQTHSHGNNQISNVHATGPGVLADGVGLLRITDGVGGLNHHNTFTGNRRAITNPDMISIGAGVTDTFLELTPGPGQTIVSVTDTGTRTRIRTVDNIAITPRYPMFRMFGLVGDDTADDTAALNAAVTAGKTVGLPVIDNVGGTYKLTGTIDARCTISGANQADDFKGILGLGREATVFNQYTNNIPIFRFSGRYFDLSGFTAKHNTIQTMAQTSGSVFDLEDWVYFCTFQDLRIANGYQGFNSKNGSRSGFTAGAFSNTFDDIRFEDNHYVHWSQNATAGGGTGNVMKNIYMGSDGVDRMYRAVQRYGGFEDTWTQLNIEQTTFEDCAFFDENGDSLTINAMHIEGCRFPCGSGQRAIVATNGRGIVRLDVGIDECFFGPHKVSGITRSGTTATATIDLLGKPLGGHGLRAGDTIVVSGANESAYNVTATVIAVPTTTTVTYAVAGSPATPATLAAGNDYIQMSLGAALGAAGISVVRSMAGAETVDLDVRTRDVRVTGNNREPTFRLAATGDANARVKLRNLSTRGQIDNAHLAGPIDIVALSRTSNVVTAYTRIPHRLRVGNATFVATGTGVGFGSGTVSSVPGPHSFTYTAAGADSALISAAGSDMRLQTYATTARARSAGLAYLTCSVPHQLADGMRVRVSNVGGTGYNTADTVITVVSASTFSYVNAGSDETSIADTGGSIMAFDPGISFHYLTEPSDATILMEADFLYSGCECLAVGTVNAGTAATQTTTHYGARVGDRIDWTAISALPDGLQVQATVTATDTITWRVFNGTGSNIVSGVKLVTYKFSRS